MATIKDNGKKSNIIHIKEECRISNIMYNSDSFIPKELLNKIPDNIKYTWGTPGNRTAYFKNKL